MVPKKFNLAISHSPRYLGTGTIVYKPWCKILLLLASRKKSAEADLTQMCSFRVRHNLFQTQMNHTAM